MNDSVKDSAHEALDGAGRRRLNGVAAQSILTAVLLLPRATGTVAGPDPPVIA